MKPQPGKGLGRRRDEEETAGEGSRRAGGARESNRGIGGENRRREGEREEERREGVRIVQINCNKSTNVMQGVMEVGGDADIIAIQEPWIGREQQTVDQTKYALTVGHAGYDIIFRKNTDGEKARVMWMVRKDRGLRYSIHNDLWDNRDASVMDVTLSDNSTLRIINIYHQANQTSKGSPGCVLRRFPPNLCHGQITAIVGDFNAHSQIWNPRITKPIREEEVMEIMETQRMTLINEYGRITRRAKNSESVLDLAWVSENHEEETTWELRDEDEIGSDHALIRMCVGGKKGACISPMTAQRQYKATDWEATAQAASKEIQKATPNLREMEKERKWEEMVTVLEQCLASAADAGTPKSRPCWRSKSWFDEEVKAQRKELARKGRWRRNHIENAGAREEWSQCRNKYFRTIRKKKREKWDKYVGEAKGSEIWGVWRMASTKRTGRTINLYDAATNTTKRTFQEKEALFAQKLFPAEKGGDAAQGEYNLAPRGTQIVSNEEARRAIAGQGQMKAPGEDGLVCRVITKCWESCGDWVACVYTGLLQDGHHPKQWRRAIVAVIPKPNKPDYQNAKAYRPISLLAAMGKGLERVVADLLAAHGEKAGLHRDQWGGVRGRSAEECVTHMVDRIDHARRRKMKVTILASDIQQAFPSVPLNRLSAELTKQGVDPSIVKWVRSFMTDRTAKIRFDAEEGPWRSVPTGIPQGSPVSPILFNLYISRLLKEMDEAATEREMRVYFPTFINYVTIVLESASWREGRKDGKRLLECM